MHNDNGGVHGRAFREGKESQLLLSNPKGLVLQQQKGVCIICEGSCNQGVVASY